MGVLYIGHTKVGEFVFANKYKVTLTGDHCTFIGAGYHNYSLIVTIEAIPELGYNFYSWSDGNTENPRLIRIDGDIELLAKVDLYYIHYTATADISDTMPTNWGDAILVNDSCTYNADTLEGSLAFLNVPTEIPKTTFYYNKYIISITPNYIVSIGDQAFENCSGLTSVTIGNSVTSIGNYAFLNCGGLASITYKGTIEQWNAITKISTWHIGVPAKLVHCTDGDVSLN